jgi:hypothetical protein
MMSFRPPCKRKTKTWFILIFFSIFGFNSNAQSGSFSLLTGSSEEIITSYYDRDSSQLFTLDKAGFVVVWDVETLLPLRRFSTVPLHPFYSDRSDIMTIHPTLKANKSSLWITHNTVSNLGAVFSDVYSKKGKFYGSTDTGYVRRIHYLSNNDFVVTHCSETPFYDNGKNIYGYLALQKAGDTSFISLPLDKLATTIEASPDERFLAVGYERGGVDVVSVDGFKKILQSEPGQTKSQYVDAIKFLPNNRGFLYSYFFETGKVYVQYMNETAPWEIDLPETAAQVKIEISPSGKFAALLLDQMHIWIYDLAEKKFCNSRAITKVDHINNIFFLTDDVLLTCGNSRHSKGGFYSFIADESSLQKLDWKESLWSDNFSYDPLTAVLHNADITVINDSTYQLTQTNKWQYQLTPSNLKNSYFRSDNYVALNSAAASFGFKQKGFMGESGLVQNDSDSSFVWSALPVDSFKVLLLKQKIENENFVDAFPVKNFTDYKLTRIHASKKLILWTKETFSKGLLNFFIADANGKIIFRDSTSMLYAGELRFSPLGNWFCYQGYEQKNLTVVALGKKSTKTIINTGRNNYSYTGAKLRFVEDSKVVYEVLSDDPSETAFRVVTLDLEKATKDTLIKLSVRPYSYTVDKGLKKLAVYYPVDLTDSLFFSDADKVSKAARYGFRNIYNPVIILYDLANGGNKIIHAYNKIPIEKLALMGDKIIALQKDGMINYYKAETGKSIAVHWLLEKEQVVMDPNYYYATTGMVSNLFLQADEKVLPAGQRDVVYNNPAAMMKLLGSKNQSLSALYQRAYDKRIKQTSVSANAKAISYAPVLKPDTRFSRQLLIKDSVIQYKLNLKQKGAAVKSVFVKVNDFPVYGKEGMAVAKGTEEVTLSLPLDSGYNNISIHVLDQENQSSASLRLTYHARYNKPVLKSRLWIIAAGVSNYADTLNNLKYAAIDAVDFSRVFSYKNNFDTVIVSTLANEQVTATAIIGALKKISAVNKNDVVIVYLAGHGLLDDKADFYFATHDIDFRNPDEKGLSYTTLLSAIESLPARHKVLFLDACHSGVVDKSMFRKTEVVGKSAGTALLRQGTRGGVLLNSGKQDYKEQDVFLFMQKIFADLSQDNSTNILAASLGNSFALENSQLQNGLFTYSIIKGLGLAKASRKEFYASEKDYAEGSVISISDLQEYLANEVLLLSKGAQVPSFKTNKIISDRIIFAEGNFPAYLFSSFDEKAASYKAFLDRYKAENN